jgi:L-malate glycosyltransferase
VRRIAARIALGAVYLLVLAIVLVGRIVPRSRWRPLGRIIVIGTFHNPNWYLSHIAPLAQCGLEEVIVVTDSPQPYVPLVRCICPPRWVQCILSRGGAKVLWAIAVGVRRRPDVYIGYHICPGAVSALVVGSILGRPSVYQMTGGPVELIGGGYCVENRLMRLLGSPSRGIEKLALLVVRQFQLVVVRGTKAQAYLSDMGHTGMVRIITGSVRRQQGGQAVDRCYDLVFVGRLTPTKQPWVFVEAASEVIKRIPGAKGVMVGDGPLESKCRQVAGDLGVEHSISFMGQRSDVESILAASKVFMLTSRSEGMSIAMAEAMVAGAVPVVADVGELSDVIRHGQNGYLVEPGNTRKLAEYAVCLLEDRQRWSRLSRQAREDGESLCGIGSVSKRWQAALQAVVRRASGAWSSES